MSSERISDAVERLRHIVASVLELDLVEVTAGASFQHDLKMDSLEKVEFAARVEWAFGVALSDEEASGIDSARAAAVLLESRLPPAAGAGGTVPEAGVAVPEAARSAGVRTAPSPPDAGLARPGPLSAPTAVPRSTRPARRPPAPF
ncbi:phosphopantetheine-binding protein, partial [Streptomyces rhizosphaericola]|uniref:acyl carrier protein n=1 Tax=Streptomyces rhizosphaericola TaxID=2564098 RepID=UPI003BF53779